MNNPQTAPNLMTLRQSEWNGDITIRIYYKLNGRGQWKRFRDTAFKTLNEAFDYMAKMGMNSASGWSLTSEGAKLDKTCEHGLPIGLSCPSNTCDNHQPEGSR